LQAVLPEPAVHFHIAGLLGPRLKRVCGVQSAGAADGTADFGAVERFINDLADGTGAAAALGTAAEATIDVARGAARRSAGSASHFVVTQDVAGTNNHLTPC
jgi:hypothetical protein